MSTTLKKIVYILSFLFTFMVVSSVVKYVVVSIVPNSPSPKALEEALIGASSEMNKTLPTKIDEITQLVSTSVNGNELIYSYRIATNSPISQSDLDTSLRANIVNQVCTTKATKNLLDMGASLVYSYSVSSGGYIGKITVSLSDCRGL